MMLAPTTEWDFNRVDALRRTHLLDTLPEQSFDDLVLIASQICGTPIALVSLVDEHRQWFKAKVGVELTETPRNISFCDHALRQSEVFVVSDTHFDPRFRDNPFVTGAPGIRFYAGAPLIDEDGHALGTICVIDREPRTLSNGQIACLEALSRLVMDQIELRKSHRDLASALEIECRLQAEKQAVVKRSEKITEELERFAYVTSHDLRVPLRGIGQLAEWVHEDLGEDLDPEVQTNLTMLRNRVRRLDMLIVSLLAYSRTCRETSKSAIVDTEKLVRSAFEGLGAPRTFESVIAEGMPVFETFEVPLRGVFEHIVGNAIKHHDGDGGLIEVGWSERGDEFVFTVADDGPGILPAFRDRIFGLFKTLQPRDKKETAGVGLSIVQKTLRHFDGWVEVEGRDGRGSLFRFGWPRSPESIA